MDFYSDDLEYHEFLHRLLPLINNFHEDSEIQCISKLIHKVIVLGMKMKNPSFVKLYHAKENSEAFSQMIHYFLRNSDYSDQEKQLEMILFRILQKFPSNPTIRHFSGESIAFLQSHEKDRKQLIPIKQLNQIQELETSTKLFQIDISDILLATNKYFEHFLTVIIKIHSVGVKKHLEKEHLEQYSNAL